AADAHRRELRPGDRSLEQFYRFHTREDDSLRAAIESTSAERIFQLRAAHNQRKPYQYPPSADILHKFEIETRMLGVDKSPMKSRGSQDLRHFRRTQLSKSRAKLQLALFEGLFNCVFSHEKAPSDCH